MNTLYLTLKKEWFYLIFLGEKKEEYREIKPYYLVRFIEWKGMAKKVKQEMCDSLKSQTSAARWNFKNNYCNNINFDTITFRNGYAKNAPTIVVECLGITIGTCRPEWSDNAQGEHFVIHLGKIISTQNIIHIKNTDK